MGATAIDGQTENASSLSKSLKDHATTLGFVLTGICPAVSPGGFTRLGEWLELGYAGEMSYLADRQEAYSHPRHVLDGVRSIAMLAMPYRTTESREPSPGQGRISCYAWGELDYHDVIHERLKQLSAFLKQQVPDASVRGVVDSAPLLEREFAQLAGLGWVGKNTLLLNRQAGSWFFLAALLTDVELEYDEPFTADHCGTCRACLDACPTAAFPQPYVLDATRCISYLTIELRTAIPESLRGGMGDWLFGCDVCQQVCPWNHKADSLRTARQSELEGSAFAPRHDLDPVDLISLFELDDESFRNRFRRTPLWRSKRRGILRNAAIVLGNHSHAAAVPALARGLADMEALVRGACAWALGRYDSTAARQALGERLDEEPDDEVRREITDALNQHAARNP